MPKFYLNRAASISEKVRATSAPAGSSRPSWRAICEIEKMPHTVLPRSATSACWRPSRRSVSSTCPTREASTSARSITSISAAGVMMSATLSSSRRRPRPVATCIGRSPRRSGAVIRPRMTSRSSTTRSSRTPRVIMNWFAPASGACCRMVAGLTRARSVITCSAGESGVTRAAGACVGRRHPAPAPSPRIGHGWNTRSIGTLGVMGEPRRNLKETRGNLRVLALRKGFGAPHPPAAVGLEVAVQLDQRLPVHLALELDHRVERHPVVVPAPRVELGMAARAQLHVAVAPRHAQQVPDLLLPAVGAARLLRAAHPLLRHLVAQPVARAAEDAHVRALQPDLLLELAEHRLQRGFAVLDAALGKLPGVLVHALAPEHLVSLVGKDDADVRPVAFLVEHRSTALS